MTGQQIDDVARWQATRLPRRLVLRGLAGGALAAVLTRLGPGEVDAKPKKKCKQRKKPGQKCKLNNGAKCKCRGGAKCKGGVCTCPTGSGEVAGVCVMMTCRPNGLICSQADACCSNHCGFLYNEFRCCVPNDEICEHGGVCCQSGSTPAACENGRCCREEGAICDAVDSPVPPAKCCAGTVCSSETYRCEPI